MNPFAHPSWLPVAPDDFAARVKVLRQGEGDPGAELRHLATHALDANQLQRLARVIAELPSSQLTPFRLGLLSNATTDFVAPALIGTGARHGLAIECVTTGFGQFVQEALDPGSALNRAGCDAVLLALDARAFALGSPPGDAEAAATAIARSLAQLDAMIAGLAPHCGTVIIQSIPPLAERHLGNFDAGPTG